MYNYYESNKVLRIANELVIDILRFFTDLIDVMIFLSLF